MVVCVLHNKGLTPSLPACFHRLQEYNSTLNKTKCIYGLATLLQVYPTLPAEGRSGEVFSSKRIKVKRFRDLVNVCSGIVFFSQFHPIYFCFFFQQKLWVDGLTIGLVTILCQIQVDGILRSMSYANRFVSVVECQHCSQLQREART